MTSTPNATARPSRMSADRSAVERRMADVEREIDARRQAARSSNTFRLEGRTPAPVADDAREGQAAMSALRLAPRRVAARGQGRARIRSRSSTEEEARDQEEPEAKQRHELARIGGRRHRANAARRSSGNWRGRADRAHRSPANVNAGGEHEAANAGHLTPRASAPSASPR